MSAIGYYILLPLIYFAAILPFPLFYLLSDFHFFIIYHLIGYRRKVVMQNLRNSFPHKTEDELKKLEKKFYRYLCDFFLETFKTLTISEKEMLKRCSFTEETKKLLNDYAEKQQSIILVMGHYGNWEWAGNSFSILCKQQLYVIYHPLTNKHFNALIVKMRLRFGTKLIAMKDTLREMLKNRNHVSATAFIADQTPPVEGAYWTSFMNQDTPVFNGTEKIAKKLNCPVVYISVKLKKRGYYEVMAEELCKSPSETKNGELSEMHTRRLERDIHEQPYIWLWSHRRWKHKRPKI